MARLSSNKASAVRGYYNWNLFLTEYLTFRSGYELAQLISDNNVVTPSVQGVWSPFLNRPTNLLGKEFPIDERSAFIPEEPSASQQLIDLVKKYKLSAIDEANMGKEEQKWETEIYLVLD